MILKRPLNYLSNDRYFPSSKIGIIHIEKITQIENQVSFHKHHKLNRNYTEKLVYICNLYATDLTIRYIFLLELDFKCVNIRLPGQHFFDYIKIST